MAVANQMLHVDMAKETATETGTVIVDTKRMSVETATVKTSRLLHPVAVGQIVADLGLIQTHNH